MPEAEADAFGDSGCAGLPCRLHSKPVGVAGSVR